MGRGSAVLDTPPDEADDSSAPAHALWAWLQATLRSPWSVLVGAFVLSRLAYAALGVRFDVTPLHSDWQHVDPVAIDEDPIGTFFHLHFQRRCSTCCWRQPGAVPSRSSSASS